MKYLENINETIVAISSAYGYGAIGIIRLSGKDSFKIAERNFYPVKKIKKKIYGKQYYGIIKNKNNKDVDEVVVVFRKNNTSYTRENIVEVFSHGNPLILSEIEKVFIESGARSAYPGEFTFRALKNGRIDLIQAESINNLIMASDIMSKNVYLNMLKGVFSEKIENIKENLLLTVSNFEAGIDFNAHDIDKKIDNKKNIEKNIKKIEEILDISIKNKANNEVVIALVGKANVGKSSILNRILAKERAIVTEHPGTTRDIVSESIILGGFKVKFLDTAGIRRSYDRIEKIGIQKTIEAIDICDLAIFIIEEGQKLTKDDFKIRSILNRKDYLLVVNKIDLKPVINNDEIIRLAGKKNNIVKISAINGKNIKELETKIENIVRKKKSVKGKLELIISSRQETNLIKSKEFLKQAIKSIKTNLPAEIIGINLRDAMNELNQITGKITNDDILGNIFSNFCIGK